MSVIRSELAIVEEAIFAHPWNAVAMAVPAEADAEFLGWMLWNAREARSMARDIALDEVLSEMFRAFMEPGVASFQPISEAATADEAAIERIAEIERRIAYQWA